MRATLVFASLLAGCSASSYRAGASRPSYAAGPAGLRAGVIDDHDRIGAYVAYVDSVPRPDLPKVDLSDRRILTFTSADGTPLWDEPVGIASGGRTVLETRTSAKGEVLFAARDSGRRPFGCWIVGLFNKLMMASASSGTTAPSPLASAGRFEFCQGRGLAATLSASG